MEICLVAKWLSVHLQIRRMWVSTPWLKTSLGPNASQWLVCGGGECPGDETTKWFQTRL